MKRKRNLLERVRMEWRIFKYEIEKMRIKRALRKIEKRKNSVLKQLKRNG